MKNIIANATICDIKPTGLGVYTLSIIRELQEKKENINFKVIINKKIRDKYLKDIDINTINSPSFILSNKGWLAQLARIFYLNINFLLLSKKNNTILNTVPEGSLFCNNQVTVIHDILPLLYKEEYSKSYYYYKYYVPFLLKRSKKIVVPSNSTKKDIENVYKIDSSKVTVAPNGYDSKHFNPKSEIEIRALKQKYRLSDYFLYVGNMYPHKNLTRLVNSFKTINKKYPQIKLLIVGDKSHWNYQNLQKQVDLNRLDNAILFLDYVKFEELPILYSGALAFVYPSLYEGFGLPIIEAMACGAPVITSKSSSLEEIARNYSVLIDPESSKDITDAMMQIIDNHNLRKLLREKGMEHAKNYSWEKTANIIYSQI